METDEGNNSKSETERIWREYIMNESDYEKERQREGRG